MSSMHLSRTRKWFMQSPPVEWALFHLRELLVGSIRQGPVPQHVAFVMDGNRRFARSRKIETVEGHNLGFEAMAKILEVCYKSGVKIVTIYAFSIENFKRSRYEVDALMSLAKLKLTQLAQHGELLSRYGASVRILGQRDLLKPDVIEAMDRAVELTKDNGDAILNVCFPYTSRDEMTTAVRTVVEEYSKPAVGKESKFSETHITHNIRSRHLSASAEQVRANSPSSGATSDTEDTNLSTTSTLPLSQIPENVLPPGSKPSLPNYPDPEAIDSSTLTSHMFTKENPPVDLLVRTSGVERLSDFMLWQVHEDTDIVFLECMWPEFDLWSFLPVLVEWQWRRRKEVSDEKGQIIRRRTAALKTE